MSYPPPPSEEEILSSYNNERWRAWKLNTPSKSLERMATSEDEGVRLAVAWHPSTPLWTLKGLADDEEKRVRIAAQTRLKE